MTQTLLLILVIGIGLFYAVIYGNKAKKDIVKYQQTEKITEQNTYLEMRKMALNVTAEQLGFKIPEDSIKVYGIITDLDMGAGTATVVTYLTGDASIYLSSGGAFIGAGQHESIQRVAKEFVDNGHVISFRGKTFENADLPTNGNANFYFLSNKSKTRITESIAKMESGESEFSKLFADLNIVMTEIQLKSGQ
ncbi:hypothetical protein [Leeuwenhoekiella parthenopeia]|uniref:Uncharacterized protein n=1 Tax=Leeuwenhoekiella parthenopeia TaxID=2890320 RepID=A0ABS8H191_9FLAO|nr:hypothetical protein [Leeuwenhoekiella parthenopeia]MCC4214583.1 hypothetical protein [Leeuwenhoekiella parthenopeia]